MLSFFFADIKICIFSGPSEDDEVGQELALLNRDSLNDASAYNNSEETTEVPMIDATLKMSIDQNFAIPQSPSTVYCLLDLYKDQNIIDRNLEGILSLPTTSQLSTSALSPSHFGQNPSSRYVCISNIKYII